MNDPAAPDAAARARRAPRLELPPYRYLPGRTPHPLRHAGGHLQRAESPRPADRAEALAYALDLFAARYYWEAHEVWEETWRAATGVERDVLQSLIQLAAGYLKLELGSRHHAHTLFVSASARLVPLRDRIVLGLDVARICDTLEHAQRAEPHDPTAWIP